MPRAKQYIEEEVIEKAMELFWRNGYEATSVRMLEKTMGINQFSIYASFKNKQGVFLKSIDSYRSRVKANLIDKLESTDDGLAGIKQYYYDFLDFSRGQKCGKGCLITNTASELGKDGDKKIIAEVMAFASQVRSVFTKKLSSSITDSALLKKQVNYLMVAIQGLSVASKMFDQKQLHDYIELTFKDV